MKDSKNLCVFVVKFKKTLPKNPIARSDNINSQNQIGQAMRDNTVIEMFGAIQKKVVNKAGNDACQPEMMFRSE